MSAPTVEDAVVEIVQLFQSTPLGRARGVVMPLEQLPWDVRVDIVLDAISDTKPAKWRTFHDDKGRPMAVISSRAWYEWHWCRGVDPDTMRRGVPPKLRQTVIERDGYTCGLCGGEVAPDDVDIDHIVPVSRGGTDDPHNLQVSHSRCNRRKGDRL